MFSFCAVLSVFEAVAVAVGLDDVDAVGDAVEERAGHTLVAEYVGPVLKGQVGGEENALAFVGAAYDLEEEFGAGLGKRDIAELVEDEQVEFGQAVEESFELAFFSGLEELGDEAGDGEEAHALALGADSVSEGGGEMGLAGAGIADEQDVFLDVEIVAAHEFKDERLVDAGLGREVKGIQRLEDGKPGGFEPTFGRALFAVQQFPFGQAQEEGDVVLAFLSAGGGDGEVFPKHGGQLKLLEVMFEQDGRLFASHQLSPPSRAR